jgi:hypothetical protein
VLITGVSTAGQVMLDVVNGDFGAAVRHAKQFPDELAAAYKRAFNAMAEDAKDTGRKIYDLFS